MPVRRVTPLIRDIPGLSTALVPPKSRHTHHQAEPALVWTIDHGLGFRPAAVSVYMADGTQVSGGRVHHVDDGQLTIAFGSAIAGEAEVA
ncbi:MAG: hypothetical protein QM770_10920 [Tepidisphaeraceae bacterium]